MATVSAVFLFCMVYHAFMAFSPWAKNRRWEAAKEQAYKETVARLGPRPTPRVRT